jgi:hypothetical protein
MMQKELFPNTRSLMVDYLKGNTSSFNLFGSSTTSKPKKKSLLLVDEVDVFFGESFYGSYYASCRVLKDPAITKLLRYMWENKDKHGTSSPCADCGTVKDTGMLRCSKCKSVRYCSTECQKNHWNEHKPSCNEAVDAGYGAGAGKMTTVDEVMNSKFITDVRAIYPKLGLGLLREKINKMIADLTKFKGGSYTGRKCVFRNNEVLYEDTKSGSLTHYIVGFETAFLVR